MIIPFVECADRFWQKVMKTEGCWEWVACKNSDGYGQFGFRGKVEGAHRVVWILERGEIPNGLHVLHVCDNRACVNPSHLFLGTHQDNMEDRTKKGKSVAKGKPGEACPSHKLTEKEVLRIRELHSNGERQSQLATMFGVHKATVNDLVLRKTWIHL